MGRSLQISVGGGCRSPNATLVGGPSQRGPSPSGGGSLNSPQGNLRRSNSRLPQQAANAYQAQAPQSWDDVEAMRYAKLAMQVESDEESDVCRQIAGMRMPAAMPAPQMPVLSSGGRYDDLLLRHGSSHQLVMLFPELFGNDPPTDAGRRPDKAGRFHGQTNTYGKEAFSPDAVVRMLGLASSWWDDAPNVGTYNVPPRGRLIFVGDTHGQLEDVLWMFFKYGVPSRVNQYMFIGDIVDRGGHALDILLLLFAFKRDDPASVHILRGNHEDSTTCSMYGFKAELETKFSATDEGGWVYTFITNQVLPLLPLGAVVGERGHGVVMFVIHGGVPVRLPGQTGPIMVADIERLNRKVVTTQNQQSPEDLLMFNLLWADPLKQGEEGKGPRGRGNTFTEEDTMRFCRANGVSCVIRAHQPPSDLHGFEYQHQNRCITVFSASNYCGNLGNKGGVLICDFQSYAQSGPMAKEHWAPAWPQLQELCRDPANNIVTATGEQRQRVAMSVEADSANQDSSARALEQVTNKAIDEICRQKEALYQAFAQSDLQDSGMVSLSVWEEVMATCLPNVPKVWLDLAGFWRLSEPVQYVQFLHRFQILADMGNHRNSTHVDLLTKMSELRANISDTHADHLLATLDQDFSGSVDLREFEVFLRKNQVEVPQWQAAALFEAMVMSLGRNPGVEDIILALALVGVVHPRSPDSFRMNNLCKMIGEGIIRTGKTLVGFFRQWDTDHNGWLRCSELEWAIRQGVPEVCQKLAPGDPQAIVMYIDNGGVANDRISLIEFLRAVGPPSVARALHYALIGELLKPVYFHKPMLISFMSAYDPASSNTVNLDEFRAGLEEMNRQLNGQGWKRLSSNQVNAICEIASGGGHYVQYRDFLGSLKASDTERRKASLDVVRFAMRSAFG